jgi:glutathione synthase/RimK-type ligase-like ATP-grasp enzyme
MEIDSRIDDPAARHFAYQECVSALYGMLQCCNTLWVNDIQNDTAAEYKPYQLKVARECGFTVPDTLFTSDPAAVLEFRNHYRGSVIYKAFNQRGLVWRPTRVLREEDLAMLDNIRHAPVIFQPVVPGIRDVRVTIIGHQIIASEFDIENMEGVDYRMRMGEIPCRPHELPSTVASRVRGFMARLGLEYGGIDLRLTPEGQYVFFEINTAGEFLYVEDRTGQPISAAMAAHLATGQASHPGKAAR